MSIGGPTPIRIMDNRFEDFLNAASNKDLDLSSDKNTILNIFRDCVNEREFGEKISKSRIKDPTIKEVSVYLLHLANGAQYKIGLEKLRAGKDEQIQRFVNKNTGGMSDLAGEIARKAAAKRGEGVRVEEKTPRGGAEPRPPLDEREAMINRHLANAQAKVKHDDRAREEEIKAREAPPVPPRRSRAPEGEKNTSKAQQDAQRLIQEAQARFNRGEKKP